MSLDAPKSDAELLAMHAERMAKSRRATFGALPTNTARVETACTVATSATVTLRFDTFFMPLRLRVPWSCLISDNAMYVSRDGKRFKSPDYRAARKALRELAADAMTGRPPADCPLAVVGRVWVPNNQRRDVHNFGAALVDSLKGIVFTDDHWLHDVRWIRAGVDVDAPRCELTISPLNPSTSTP